MQLNEHDDLAGPAPKMPKLETDTPILPAERNEAETIAPLPEQPACRVISVQTDVHREFMHIVLKSNSTDYGQAAGSGSGSKAKKPMITCDSHEGPFLTKWSLHFYPEGHPSNYSFHPDVEWFPAQYVPDDQKFASLYVRLKDGPFEMIEARMMTSVLSGESDIEAALATNMERFMLCPRMKVDEFHREAAGHGWPKLCLTNSLKNFNGGFICVVSLQVLQPASGGSPITGVRRPAIPIRRYHDLPEVPLPYMLRVRENHAHTDAVLQAVDWQYVPAHRFVLATRSGFFRALMTSDQGVPFVYKTNHTMEELNYLLDMIYLNKLPERDKALSARLHDLAVLYDVPFVSNVLADEIRETVGSNEEDGFYFSMSSSNESMMKPANPYEQFKL